MRKIIYWVHTSIDGHIAGQNGEFDWPVVGTDLFDYSEGLTRRVDTFIYGRRVWEMMASYWPTADETSTDSHDVNYAPIWRETPKIVFSNTLEKADWNTQVIGGDLATEVAALKRQPGKDLLLTGGSTLATSLTELGLIDEYHVVIHPVLLGGGRPLFPARDERLNLRLVDSRIFDAQTVLLHYQRP